MKKVLSFSLTIFALMLITMSIVVITAPLTPDVHAQSQDKGDFSLSSPPYYCLCPGVAWLCPCPPDDI
ncbi:MAG: hypothetical protein ACTSUC_09570 [Promethearchaeota archaeon]